MCDERTCMNCASVVLRPSCVVIAVSFVAVCGAVPIGAATSTLSVLPRDGQTVKFRLTGDRQGFEADRTFNTLVTLVRTGDQIAVTSAPSRGTPLTGDARVLDDGSLLIATGTLALQLNALSLASTVAVAAPGTLSLVSTWKLNAPAILQAGSIQVPVTVIVSDDSPDHTALSVQGRTAAPLDTQSGTLQGTISVNYALTFRNGAFSDGHGVIFGDASPSSGFHTVTNWHLVPEA